MQQEIWKDIPDYKGRYQVSNLGNVRFIGWGKCRIRKPITTKEGYLFVSLRNLKTKRQTTLLVHRLVAIVFIPNPNHYKEINHKNEIKADNKVENLEWCTRKYNMEYGRGKQKKIENQYKSVLCLNLKNEIVAEYKSIQQASETIGIHNSNISHCLNGTQQTAGGFKWKYKNKTI